MATSRVSAGLLMCRYSNDQVQVLLVHPGGPLWARKDDGAWSIPKGEAAPGEDLLAAARREFSEETRLAIAPDTRFLALGEVRQKGGKIVHAWAFAGDCDPAAIRSNSFAMQWPPRSGKTQTFPEVDRAEFFDPEQAKIKILASQVPLLERVWQPDVVDALFADPARDS